ncbi:MAG: extensin family protein [Polyangiaceae bacterium]|nr:extensin family protein [Polyangiaceae bacterium]MBK8937390.1 extensin family protein [Polyangiaceae bacterium]
MRALARVAAAALAIASLASPRAARADSPFLEAPPQAEASATPAYRYANMSNEQALAELDRRGVSYVKVGPHGTVRSPIRLTGPLHGVDVHGALPPDQRKDSMFEVLDARLALALDDFCVLLERHDVVELVHYTMYRPNVPSPEEVLAMQKAGLDKKEDSGKKATSEPTEKPTTKKRGSKRRAHLDPKGSKSEKTGGLKTRSKRGAKELEVDADAALRGGPAELAKPAPKKKPAPAAVGGASKAGAPKADAPTTKKGAATKVAPAKGKPTKQADAKSVAPQRKWAPPGTRHPAGLAIDVGALKKSDGTTLLVSSHFDGKIGDKTCGAGVNLDGKSAAARELRQIVCSAKDAGIFTYALTPNFDADHADHFHMEIKPGVSWFLYH